jgi:hypothetical protein
MLYEFQKLHESEIDKVFLFRMELRECIDFDTKTVHWEMVL